jgi:hypothetical protein
MRRTASPSSTARLLARDQNRYMETQPKHAAAQVTLLEASFVFLPCLRQVPLVRGGNSSSEQVRRGRRHFEAIMTLRKQLNFCN